MSYTFSVTLSDQSDGNERTIEITEKPREAPDFSRGEVSGSFSP